MSEPALSRTPSPRRLYSACVALPLATKGFIDRSNDARFWDDPEVLAVFDRMAQDWDRSGADAVPRSI